MTCGGRVRVRGDRRTLADVLDSYPGRAAGVVTGQRELRLQAGFEQSPPPIHRAGRCCRWCTRCSSIHRDRTSCACTGRRRSWCRSATARQQTGKRCTEGGDDDVGLPVLVALLVGVGGHPGGVGDFHPRRGLHRHRATGIDGQAVLLRRVGGAFGDLLRDPPDEVVGR